MISYKTTTAATAIATNSNVRSLSICTIDDDDINSCDGNCGDDFSHNGDGVSHVNIPHNESGKEEEMNVVNNASRERNGYHRNNEGYENGAH